MDNNVVARISHSECKDVLLKKVYLIHSMNKKSKTHEERTYKTNSNKKLSYFDDKIYILNNGYD